VKNLGVTEENFKMNLKEIGWERGGLNSCGSCQVYKWKVAVNRVMKLRVL